MWDILKTEKHRFTLSAPISQNGQTHSTICPLLLTNCLSVFDHFVVLGLNGLNEFLAFISFIYFISFIFTGHILVLYCVWLSNAAPFCENYANLYFDAKHLEKGLNTRELEFFGPFFHTKVPILANIECCPKSLEYALFYVFYISLFFFLKVLQKLWKYFLFSGPNLDKNVHLAFAPSLFSWNININSFCFKTCWKKVWTEGGEILSALLFSKKCPFVNIGRCFNVLD